MSDRIERLEKRLTALESISAIKDMKIGYWRAIDLRQPERAREFLSPDAYIDMEGVPCHEADAFIAFVARASARDGVYNLHTGQNPTIVLNGADDAIGRWDMLFTSIDVPSRLVIQMTGAYEDVYVRRDNRWLIQRMQFRQTSFLMSRIDDRGQSQVLSLGQNNLAAFDQ